MPLLIKESQLRRLIRRTLHEGFPEELATPPYQTPPAPLPPPDHSHKYQTFLHFSGLSCQDALLQYLQQNIQTLFDTTRIHQNSIISSSEYPARDKSHEGVANRITRSLRYFFLDYFEIPADAGHEFELRGFQPIVGTFSNLLTKPFVSQLLLSASTPSPQLAQEIYDAILQFPPFQSTICPDFNHHAGQLLSQFHETQVLNSNALAKQRPY